MRPIHSITAVALAGWLVAAVLPAQAQTQPDMRLPKKLVEVGWDTPDTSQVRQNLQQMEKLPFDGIMINANGHIDATKRCRLRSAFSADAWQEKWFQPCIDNLKACHFTRFTDNFLMTGANPGNVDWFDDAGWKNIVEHFRIAARIARQGGLKGILFDPEPYTRPYQAFMYSAQPQAKQHTFDQYWNEARERGRQVMQAITSEYPDITLFTFFMLSANKAAAGHADPRAFLRDSRYGLYVPFMDGWLDAMPPTVTIVDGCESSYLFNSVDPFLESAVYIKGEAQSLVAPEDRAKYRAQVQVSFGIYMDAYANPKTSRYYIDGLGGPRVDRLQQNVTTALRVADRYVWIYGEQHHWWPSAKDPKNAKTWQKGLPGCEQALAFARDPMSWARDRVAAMTKAGTLVELARNGDFSSNKAPKETGMADWKPGGAPAGWSTWEIKANEGTFTWDKTVGDASKGSARAAGVSNGCFIQSYDVKPGDRYFIQAVSRTQGAGTTWLRARWQTPDGKWTSEEQDVILMPQKGAAGQWRQMAGVVQVPEGVGKMVLLLSMAGQAGPQDVAWFDDVHVNKL